MALRCIRTDEACFENTVSPNFYERLKAEYSARLQKVRLACAQLEEAGEAFAAKLRLAIRLRSNLDKLYQRTGWRARTRCWFESPRFT